MSEQRTLEEAGYDRRHLKAIAAQCLLRMGVDLKAADKPFSVKVTDSDETVYANLRTLCAGAIAADFGGVGVVDAPDELLEFLYSEGLLATAEAGVNDDEDLLDEEGLAEGVVPDEGESPVAPEPDTLDLELDAALASATELVGGETVPAEDAGQQVLDEPEDSKLTELAAEQKSMDLTERYAPAVPVVSDNAEAAVLAISEALRVGKVVLLATVELDAVRDLFALPSVGAKVTMGLGQDVPLGDGPGMSASPPNDSAELTLAIQQARERATTKIKARLKKGGDMETLEAKRAYIKTRKIQRKGSRKPLEDLSDSRLRGLIRGWAADTAETLVRAKASK